MGKMKNSRNQWIETYIAVTLDMDPRFTREDVAEEASELFETRGGQDAATVARECAGDDKQWIIGVNTPGWMKPGAEVPPGWRYEGGTWRND